MRFFILRRSFYRVGLNARKRGGRLIVSHCIPRKRHRTFLWADYSRIKQQSFRAPASIHSSAIHLIVGRSWCTGVADFRKHLAFLSFQISHAVIAKRESAPFLLSPCQRPRHQLHQSSTVPPPICEASTPSTARMFHQICRKKEHEVTI